MLKPTFLRWMLYSLIEGKGREGQNFQARPSLCFMFWQKNWRKVVNIILWASTITGYSIITSTIFFRSMSSWCFKMTKYQREKLSLELMMLIPKGVLWRGIGGSCPRQQLILAPFIWIIIDSHRNFRGCLMVGTSIQLGMKKSSIFLDTFIRLTSRVSYLKSLWCGGILNSKL